MHLEKSWKIKKRYRQKTDRKITVCFFYCLYERRKNQMTKQVVAKRSLSEGTVQLEECIWDNGSVAYDVCLIYTSSQATSKNFHSIETIEEACRIYNEYSEELCEVYKNKYRKTQRKEGKLIIQVQ